MALGDTRGLVDPVDVDPGQGTTAEPTQTFWAAFVAASGASGASDWSGICWDMLGYAGRWPIDPIYAISGLSRCHYPHALPEMLVISLMFNSLTIFY